MFGNRGVFLIFCHIFKNCLISVGYHLYRQFKCFKIVSGNDTIDYILNNRVSVSRFGDGELCVMRGKGNGFQTPNKKLASRLSEVFYSVGSRVDHIVCLPYPMQSLAGLKKKSKAYWKRFMGRYFFTLLRMIPRDAVFFDAFFTRFYISYEDKTNCSQTLNEIRKIWQDRKVAIVEGEFTRMGVGNDLFDNANSIKRVLCPSANAFDKYDDIFSFVTSNIDKDHLIICALGMTATVLTYDLSKYGYQAIDLGHLDIEYEWFLKGAQEPCVITGKAVNDVHENCPDGNIPELYYQQIICKI